MLGARAVARWLLGQDPGGAGAGEPHCEESAQSQRGRSAVTQVFVLGDAATAALRLLRVSQAGERSTMGRCCRYSACLGPRTRDIQRSSPIPHSQTSTGASRSAAGNPYHSTCTRSRQRPRQLVHQSMSRPGSPRHPEFISLPRYIGIDILKEWLMGYGWRGMLSGGVEHWHAGLPESELAQAVQSSIDSPPRASPQACRTTVAYE